MAGATRTHNPITRNNGGRQSANDGDANQRALKWGLGGLSRERTLSAIWEREGEWEREREGGRERDRQRVCVCVLEVRAHGWGLKSAGKMKNVGSGDYPILLYCCLHMYNA